MFRKTTPFAVILLLSLATNVPGQDDSQGQAKSPVQAGALPFPKNFEPARYLGKWYEIARLASPSQPAETLATAEYSRGESEELIVVKNTAYDAKGQPAGSIEGMAKLLAGDPPRLAVRFGPTFPDEANYHVMHVSKNYDLAVVGNPDRRSLWILSRKPVIGKKRIDRMITIAKNAGFETDKLIFADWKSALPDAEKAAFNVKRIIGSWEYVSGEKNGTALAADDFRGQVVEITKETITLKNEELTFVMRYELVENTNPQAVKLTITESPFGAGQKANGILELTQGTLKLCYHPMGGDTPTEFAGKSGSGQHYFVLKRVKER